MRLDLASNTLFSSNGTVVKTFSCPLRKKWSELSWTASELSRFCSACEKQVINLTYFNEDQIIALFQVNPEACAYVGFHNAKIQYQFTNNSNDYDEDDLTGCIGRNTEHLVVINTARDMCAINRAEKEGYQVLIKPTDSEEALSSKVRLIKENGVYSYSGYDCRSVVHFDSTTSSTKENLNTSPFAAYLIPKNLPTGTKVFVTDIIFEYLLESEI
ncbi:hypothetical protein [Vibrio rarus]|uniref:hypothetical protein n=1 Tax=Vibrio rarus TaxID=413403 RepID=UPI0021C47DC3|nr:hypothetical protein [Vibrio rarus]